jgi:hypothetical protein
VYEAPPIDIAPVIDEIRGLVERHVQTEERDLFPRSDRAPTSKRSVRARMLRAARRRRAVQVRLADDLNLGRDGMSSSSSITVR